MTKQIDKTAYAPVSLPIITTIFGPYGLLTDKFKEFVRLSALFALFLSLLYLLSGTELLCGNELYRANHFCNGNLWVWAGVRIINFIILCMFIRIWYGILQNGKLTDKFELIKPNMRDLKISLLVIAYIATILIAGYALYLLYVREPNPDWRIELAYFTVVSLGFWPPILALRFFVYFAFAAAGEKLPSIKEVWQKTSGNTFIIIMSLMLLLIIALLVSTSFVYSFLAAENADKLYISLAGEFLSNIISLFTAACFTNFCHIQKKFLFERK